MRENAMCVFQRRTWRAVVLVVLGSVCACTSFAEEDPQSFGVDPLPPEEKAEIVEKILKLRTVDPLTVKMFRECVYHVQGGELDGRVFPYRLFVPKGVEKGKQYPLFLWAFQQQCYHVDSRYNA